MHFIIQNWSNYEFKEIGCVGNTVWSGRIVYIHTEAKFFLEIRRTVDDTEVEINVDVEIGGSYLLSKHREYFYEGEKIKRLNFNDHSSNILNRGFAITGYVRVCCSKKEVVTQTEEDICAIELVRDFLHLLNNPDSFSDASLVCGTTKFPVHRNILSARSSVFAAMFKTQMQEGRDGVVDIVDMEPDVLQAMLKYIYSGKTDHLTSSLAGDMLYGADKYQLKAFKLVCVEQLKVSIAANNVFRSLVLGYLHDKSLKSHAVEFICKYDNFSYLEKTEGWQSLVKEQPSLAVEVTTTAVKYLQNKFGCTNSIPLMK